MRIAPATPALSESGGMAAALRTNRYGRSLRRPPRGSGVEMGGSAGSGLPAPHRIGSALVTTVSLPSTHFVKRSEASFGS